MYRVPFQEIVPLATNRQMLCPTEEGFLETAKAIRRRLYAFMKKEPESVEILSVGADKEVDRQLNSYMQIYKGMTRKNDLRKQRLVARLSRRCWEKVLQIERMTDRGSEHQLSRTNQLNSYSFRWLKATMTEEEIFRNLTLLASGETDFKSLNKLNKINGECASSNNEASENGENCIDCAEYKLKIEQYEKNLLELESRQKVLNDEIKMAKGLEKSMKTELDSLKKRLTLEQQTAQYLRSSLKSEILEKQTLQRHVDEQQRKMEKTIESYEKKLQIQKEKTSELRSLFIAQETEVDVLHEVEDIKTCKEQEEKKLVKEVKTAHDENGDARQEMKTEIQVTDTISLVMEEMSYGYIENNDSPNVKTITNAKTDDEEKTEDLENTPIKKEAVTKKGTPIKRTEDKGKKTTKKERGKKRDHSSSKRTEDAENSQDHSKKTKLDSFSKEKFVAVAYTDSASFFIGKVIGAKDNIFSVSFLNGPHQNRQTYEWPKVPLVEDIYKHQVFAEHLSPVSSSDQGMIFAEISEATFNECRKKLQKLERNSKVEKVWSDTAAPHRRVGSVSWKSLKTIQLQMHSEEEALMVSLMDGTEWHPGWINDEVIDVYMKILERNANKSGKRVITGNCRFFDLVKADKKWRSKLNISKYRKLIFPGQFGSNNHWRLGVVDLEDKSISLVDPMGTREDNPEFFKTVRSFLCKRGLPTEAWHMKKIKHPLQVDGVSCGVYVLKIAENIVMDVESLFTQVDIDDYRYEIAEKIILEA